MKAKVIKEQEAKNYDVFDFYLACLEEEKREKREQEEAFAEWLSEMYSEEQDDLAMLEPK